MPSWIIKSDIVYMFNDIYILFVVEFAMDCFVQQAEGRSKCYLLCQNMLEIFLEGNSPFCGLMASTISFIIMLYYYHNLTLNL